GRDGRFVVSGVAHRSHRSDQAGEVVLGKGRWRMASKCAACKVELVSAATAGKMKCPKCGKVYVLKAAAKPGSTPTPPPMPKATAPATPVAEQVKKPAEPAAPKRPAPAPVPVTSEGAAEEITRFNSDFKRVMTEVGKMIVGMHDVVEKVT